MLAGVVSLFSCKMGISIRQSLPVGSDDLHTIIYYAMLAGSSHNTQPWNVRVKKNGQLLILADTTRCLPVVDPENRELYISLGAFIENLNLSAGALGYTADIRLTTPSAPDYCVAEVTLSKTHPSGFSLDCIAARRTLRSPFNCADILDSDVKKVLAGDNQTYVFKASSAEGRFIAEQTLSAYRQQAVNKNAQAEFAHWVRFSDKDVQARRDGITAAGMGIGGINGFIVRKFFKPEAVESKRFVASGIEKTKQQVDNCGAWLILTGDCSVAGWIDIGRRYERMNIVCTSLHIGFQPMSQIVEEQNFLESVQREIGKGWEIQFVARIGYVTEIPSPVSPRRSVDSVAVFCK
jgi:Nitroreductase